MTTDPFAAWMSSAMSSVEAKAKEAEKRAPSPWTSRNGMVVASGTVQNRAMHPDEDLWDNEGSDTLETHPDIAAFIEVFDPATVLALVDADRKLMALHVNAGVCLVCTDGCQMRLVRYPCPTLRIRGAFWARLCPEGYDEAWRPE